MNIKNIMFVFLGLNSWLYMPVDCMNPTASFDFETVPCTIKLVEPIDLSNAGGCKIGLYLFNNQQLKTTIQLLHQQTLQPCAYKEFDRLLSRDEVTGEVKKLDKSITHKSVAAYDNQNLPDYDVQAIGYKQHMYVITSTQRNMLHLKSTSLYQVCEAKYKDKYQTSIQVLHTAEDKPKILNFSRKLTNNDIEQTIKLLDQQSYNEEKQQREQLNRSLARDARMKNNLKYFAIVGGCAIIAGLVGLAAYKLYRLYKAKKICA